MNADNLNKMAHIMNVPIQNLSARGMARIKKAPQAQLRTASYKKSVYIVNNLVFKGKYTIDEKGFFNNLKYTYAIELLESELQLSDWQKGSLPLEYLGFCGNNLYYLVFQNVGTWKNILTKPACSGYDPNVMIAPREMHVMRVSEIEETEQLTDDIKMAALQHLYLRFLLGIGDSGTHNILVRKDYDTSKKLIAGIDLEDRRKNIANNSRISLLFSKLYKKHLSLYGSAVRNINSLSYRQLSQHTLDRLHDIGIDLNQLRVNMARW